MIWATGNAPRNFTHDLISKVDAQKNARRGLLVDQHLKVDGTDNIYALGDCTFTKYPPTAQVAFQEGEYLANYFDKLHQVESLKYTIGRATEQDNVPTLSKKLARLERTCHISFTIIKVHWLTLVLKRRLLIWSGVIGQTLVLVVV